MNENFFDAAVRHWYDGKILEDAGEYDNAVCMQGFSAECALKVIFARGISQELVTKYNHNIALLLQDILTLSANDIEIVSILDPSSGLRLSQIALENILFADHPERRYFSDGIYTEENAIKCRENAQKYLKEVFRLYVDGYIESR